MYNKKVIFTAPWQVEVQDEQWEGISPGPEEAIVRKRYTLISPGTELACLSGGEDWFIMPRVPGYAAVSEIIAVGEAVADFSVGDLVFHYGNHALFQVVSTRGVFLKVPAGLPLHRVPFTRMGTVAFTALRVSQIELGDVVAITGLGLVGNMASQLARLQGASVIGVDLSSHRLQQAKQCGIHHALRGDADDLAEQIAALSGGKGVSTLIEATGLSQVAVNSLPWLAKFGEVIFLGSPRGAFQTDVTDVFNYAHLINRGCQTFKGAHEWRYPLEPDPFVKHSLVRNSQIVFDLMAREQLLIEPLISHRISPVDAREAYEGLRNDKDRYCGVLFEWDKL